MTDFELYLLAIVVIMLIAVGAYVYAYMVIARTYADTIKLVALEYEKVNKAYLALYAQYLKILETYLNKTLAMGIVPQSLPSLPAVTPPSVPVSISISGIPQVTPPVPSTLPPPPPTTTTTA